MALPALLYIHSTMWLLPACWSLLPLLAKVGLVFPHLLVWALFQAFNKPPSEGQHHILESSDKVLGPRSGFPGGAVVKNLSANAGAAGDICSIPGLGRSPGVRNGNPLQYSCLENPMDRGTWWATVPGVTETWLSTQARMQCVSFLKMLNVLMWNSSWVQRSSKKAFLFSGNLNFSTFNVHPSLLKSWHWICMTVILHNLIDSLSIDIQTMVPTP